MAGRSLGGGKLSGSRASVANVDSDIDVVDGRDGVAEADARMDGGGAGALDQATAMVASSAAARSNFIDLLGKVDEGSPSATTAMLRHVLDNLPPEMRQSILEEAGNPSLFSTPAQAAAAPQPARQMSEAEAAAIAKQKYQGRRIAEDQRQRTTFAADTHPLARPGTYGEGFSKPVQASLEPRGAERYEKYDVTDPSAPAWVERQVAYQSNPGEYVARMRLQQPLLEGVTLDRNNAQILTPEQLGMLSGVAPDQLTPDVLERIYGVKLTPEVISGLRFAQMDSLVGKPQYTPDDMRVILRSINKNDPTDIRAAASRNKKVEYLINRAAQGGQTDIVEDAERMFPFMFVRAPYFDEAQGRIVQPKEAISGDMAANWIRTGAQVGDPQFTTLVSPLLQRTLDRLAPMPRLEEAARAGYTSAFDYANKELIPGRNGALTLQKYPGMISGPFPRYSGTQLNTRGQSQTLTPTIDSAPLGGLLDDPASAAQPTISTTESPDAGQAPIMPSDADTSYFDPAMIRRMDPSILSALLA